MIPTNMQHRKGVGQVLDDCRTLHHKDAHENVASHDYYYLSDHYQLALAGPAVFVSKF